VQTRFRSPYTLSIRPTVGQNLVEELTHGAGKAEEDSGEAVDDDVRSE
jgi:hypothetical protein